MDWSEITLRAWIGQLDLYFNKFSTPIIRCFFDHPALGYRLKLGGHFLFYRNYTNTNYALAKVQQLLSYDKFTANAMILVNYFSQKDLCQRQLAMRGGKKLNRNDESFTLRKSRRQVLTNYRAQGGEAEVVIVDLISSEKPGVTSQAPVIISSRAMFSMVIVINDRVFGTDGRIFGGCDLRSHLCSPCQTLHGF